MHGQKVSHLLLVTCMALCTSKACSLLLSDGKPKAEPKWLRNEIYRIDQTTTDLTARVLSMEHGRILYVIGPSHFISQIATIGQQQIPKIAQ